MKIKMRNIRKSFGSNNVLKDVSLEIKGGEILALLGENGAGKSTLMNILGGVHERDAGSIFINEEEVHFTNPADSLAAGIAFIHQELNLINDLPVYENMFIGREIKNKFGILNQKQMIQETEEIFRQMNVDLDPLRMVSTLDSSYKQIVEICRAMMSDASIIIMDEPTTSLTEQEIDRVFEMMKTMREYHVGIIFISHKLNEVKQICDRYVVLRDGVLVSEGEVQAVTTDELAYHMVGKSVRTETLSREKNIGEEVLKLEDFTFGEEFKDINLTVREGEIIGVTGLLGDGRSELFQAVFGAYPKESGSVYLKGKRVEIHSTDQAIKEGIGYLPRNRKENSILEDMTIMENSSITTWSKYSKKGLINFQIHESIFNQHRKSLRIRMQDPFDLITKLSGGNQQKVVLSKWLATNPRILILDNPTQGVDVGAKEEIYDIILKLAEEGIAIIILSGEAQEIIRVCDSVHVMYHGKMQGFLTKQEMSEHSIMRLATGGR